MRIHLALALARGPASGAIAIAYRKTMVEAWKGGSAAPHDHPLDPPLLLGSRNAQVGFGAGMKWMLRVLWIVDCRSQIDLRTLWIVDCRLCIVDCALLIVDRR